MANRFNAHVRNDKVKWVFAAIAIILISAVLAWLITAAALSSNPICLFSHSYGEDGKCIRCGMDKPVEAAEIIAEPTEFASARSLNADSDIMPLADSPIDSIKAEYGQYIVDDLRLLKKGDYKNEPYNDCLYIYLTIDDVGTIGRYDEVYKIHLFDTVKEEVWVYFMFEYDGSIQRLRGKPVYVLADSGNVSWADLESDDDWQEWNFKPDSSSFVYMFTEQNDFNGQCHYKPFLNEVTLVYFNNLYVDTQYDIKPLVPPTKEGYDFTGWYLDEACTQPYNKDYVTGNLTLYAGWKLKEYTVTFVVDNSTFTTTTVKHGNAVMLPADTPEKEGYTFTNWKLGNDVYGNQAITEDTTLTAAFTVIRCTLTFMVDGQEYKKITVDYGTPVSAILEQTANKIMFKAASAEIMALSVEEDMAIPVELNEFGSFITQPWVMWVGIGLGVCVVCAIVGGIVVAVKKRRG
ncbi:MAG: InlB B-repeat-containing protein [Corallococcus sp.]|nr:InlB B-repeat-containing protein [Corallococcus sp.]